MIPYNVPINAQRMTIGVQGENNVREFLFDVTEWRQLTGDIGAAEMVVQRNGDSSPYATVITMKDENTVSWVPTSADTAKVGAGKIQLMWFAGSQIVKTKIFDMKADPALDYKTPDDSLDPWASWMPGIINADANYKGLTSRVDDLQQRQTSPYNFKGKVAAMANLPSSGNTVNDTYYVEAVKHRVTWTGSAWQQSSMDEEEYADELAALKDEVEDQAIYPDNTSFARRISSSDMALTAFAEAIPNIRKYESLAYYSGRLITSTGSDSYCFRAPYDNFIMALKHRGTNKLYEVTAVPAGTVNEPVTATELTGTVLDNGYTQYTIAKRGTILLFAHYKIDATTMYTTAMTTFAAPGLELDDIQDHLLRSSVQGESSQHLPPSILVKLEGKLLNVQTGGVNDSDSYDTYCVECPVSSMSVTCTNATRAVITDKPPADITGTGSLVRLVYAYNTERVETFSVRQKQFAAFSVSKALTAGIDLKTDLIRFFELPTLRLTYGQKRSFYQLQKKAVGTYLYIYYTSGDKLVQWELHNAPSPAINSNTWQLGPVCGCEFDGLKVSDPVELVGGGEFELAFKEHGAADYCGGNNHGDENTADFSLFVDGHPLEPDDADSAYHAFDRIDAIEHAVVNRCDAPAEEILHHQKIWTFEHGTVKVRQTLEFLEALKCDFLCCMLPALRTAFRSGVRHGRAGTEIMTTADFERVTTTGNEMMYLMYGPHATAKVTAKTCDHSPAAGLWINNADALNKLYYNFYAGHPETDVPAGTELWWEQTYDIAYY